MNRNQFEDNGSNYINKDSMLPKASMTCSDCNKPFYTDKLLNIQDQCEKDKCQICVNLVKKQELSFSNQQENSDCDLGDIAQELDINGINHPFVNQRLNQFNRNQQSIIDQEMQSEDSTSQNSHLQDFQNHRILFQSNYDSNTIIIVGNTQQSILQLLLALHNRINHVNIILSSELINRQSQGISQNQLNLFPEIQFQKNIMNENCNCSICISDYEQDEKLRILPCLHKFHTQCVDQWLKQNNTCPICKFDLKTLQTNL